MHNPTFPAALLSILLLITGNACNGLRHVAHENTSALSALSSGACCTTGSQTNTTCCGNTCCANNEVCERGECIPEDIVNSGRIIRLELDWPKNGLLLRNMCNGMHGNNTAILTYSGQLSQSAKAAKRQQAGCVSGYCSSLINKGTITSDLNSCDEFPPASSDQGGNTLPASDRAISCIPGYQNCIQGAVYRSLIQRTGIQAGQQFVISIDCKAVLNSSTKKRGLTEDEIYEPKRTILRTRDTVSIQGTTNSNDTLTFPNDTATYVAVPFGDLDPGTYTAQVQILSGSVVSAVVLGNEGDAYTNVSQAIAASQTQQFGFSLGGSDIGLGILVSASNNNTVIKWFLQGTLSSGTATASTPASATGRSSSGALSMFSTSSLHWWDIVIGVVILRLMS